MDDFKKRQSALLKKRAAMSKDDKKNLDELFNDCMHGHRRPNRMQELYDKGASSCEITYVDCELGFSVADVFRFIYDGYYDSLSGRSEESWKDRMQNAKECILIAIEGDISKAEGHWRGNGILEHVTCVREEIFHRGDDPTLGLIAHYIHGRYDVSPMCFEAIYQIMERLIYNGLEITSLKLCHYLRYLLPFSKRKHDVQFWVKKILRLYVENGADPFESCYYHEKSDRDDQEHQDGVKPQTVSAVHISLTIHGTVFPGALFRYMFLSEREREDLAKNLVRSCFSPCVKISSKLHHRGYAKLLRFPSVCNAVLIFTDDGFNFLFELVRIKARKLLDWVIFTARGGMELDQVRNAQGDTLLIAVCAVRGKIEKIVLHLLQAGCDPNATNLENETALHKALDIKQVESVRILLANGADLDVRRKCRGGKTPREILEGDKWLQWRCKEPEEEEEEGGKRR